MTYYNEIDEDFSSTQKSDSRYRILNEDGRIMGYTASRETAENIVGDWEAESDGTRYYTVQEIPIHAQRIKEINRIKPTDTTHKRTVGKVKTVYIDKDNQTDEVIHTQTAGKHFTSKFKSGVNKVVAKAKKPSPIKKAFIQFLDKGGDMILGMGNGFKESELVLDSAKSKSKAKPTATKSKSKTKSTTKPKNSSKESEVKKKTGTKKTATKKASSPKIKTTVKKKQTVRKKKSDDDIPMWMR